mmetsp:Transcript_9204/g.33985  ORF Transcript_9204/g.33985 Transcript_9204/m.33985 type:complete len:513 (-) Transcript_9204:3397-4935(-)
MTSSITRYNSKHVNPDSFEMENHFYQKTINAELSSVVTNFMNLGNDRIADRYAHLHPSVDPDTLKSLLAYKPKFFNWSGADLFNVTTKDGRRTMILIETNSCPSGQKSMPLLFESDEFGSYRTLIEKTFKPMIEENGSDKVPNGELAVIFDKNEMEASGYAATIAEVFQEKVHLVEYYDTDKDPPVQFRDGVVYVRQVNKSDKESWVPIRAAFRYVTQKPWNRIPLFGTKTLILNPILACVSGGRNKLLASKAYEFLNAELQTEGLIINTPKTIHDVEKPLVPLWVKTFGGYAVVKNPYANAGAMIYIITCKEDLDKFMNDEHEYEQFIVQSLIGNHKWSSQVHSEQYYHIGMVPSKGGKIYVADLRMMIHYDFSAGGFSPIAMYARRAEQPLSDSPQGNSWEQLGTNLSKKIGPNKWTTDTKRLILTAQRDFQRLGLGVDDLINAYIQTVLATVAIDKLSLKMVNQDGVFKEDIFMSLNRDSVLLGEINQGRHIDKIQKSEDISRESSHSA